MIAGVFILSQEKQHLGNNLSFLIQVEWIKYFTLFLLIPLNLFGQIHVPVELSKVGDSVWVHTTYKKYGQNIIPSNGLIIQTSGGLVFIDTPWDDSLTVALLDSTQKRFKQSVALAIITHAHDDRIGGINTLRKNGIRTVGLPLTCQRAKELGYKEPDLLPCTDTTLVVGAEKIELFYPGAGHTIDNSVVWLPERKILFGGCLVKAESFTSLGNVAEADLKEWPRSLHIVMKKFPSVHIIIPGHGSWGGSHLLQHTLDLLSVK
jgi:metallo-beta-lactamase class B